MLIAGVEINYPKNRKNEEIAFNIYCVFPIIWVTFSIKFVLQFIHSLQMYINYAIHTSVMRDIFYKFIDYKNKTRYN